MLLICACRMKRIARPRLVQFWNIWEITPEVRKRGGKERRGAKYGSILLFLQNICPVSMMIHLLLLYLSKNISVLLYLLIKRVRYIYSHTNFKRKTQLCLCCSLQYVYLFMSIFAYLYVCVFVYLCICVFVYLYICVFVYLCICVFVYLLSIDIQKSI